MTVAPEWRSVPFWSLYQRAKTIGYPNEELLSVYRDFGVIKKSERDDNWNRPGDDMGAYQLVVPGDLVLNKMKTWQGSLGVSMHRGIVSPAYFVYKPQSADNPRFLHYALRSSRYVQTYARISKGVRPNQWDLQPELLDAMQVLLPDLEMQDAIVSQLDEVAEMITKLDALTLKLLEHRRVSLEDLGRRLVEPGNRVQIGLLLNKRSRSVRSDDGVVTAYRDGQVALRSRRREDGYTMSVSESGYQGVEPGDFVFHGLDGFAGAVGASEDRGKTSPVYHVCTSTHLTSAKFMAWALRALAANGFIEAYSFSSRQRSVDLRSWATFAGMPIAYLSLEEQQVFIDHLDKISDGINMMLAKIVELRRVLAERSSAFFGNTANVEKVNK